MSILRDLAVELQGRELLHHFQEAPSNWVRAQVRQSQLESSAGGRHSQRTLPSSLPSSPPQPAAGGAEQGRTWYGWGDLALEEFFLVLFSCSSSLHIHPGLGQGGGAFMS